MKEDEKAKKTTVKKKTPAKKKAAKVVSNDAKTKDKTEFLLRSVLIVAYALIVVILLIGFLEPYINNMKVESSYKPAYLVQQEILDEEHVLKLDQAWSKLSKLEGDYFVYVGYTKMYNSEVQVLDIGIANLIDKYDLKGKFYYLNIDSILSKKNRVDLVNYYLAYKDVLVTKIPTIIYVNSENIVRPENIITRDDDKLMTVGDFQKLLDINQFVVKK